MSATTTMTSPAPAAAEQNARASIQTVPTLHSESLPSDDSVADSASVMVFDWNGTSHRFDSICSKPGQRTLVILVRHFFCGMCQEFLTSLSAAVSTESLSTLSKPASIVVVGCGDPSLIQEYADRTNCPFPIYTDTSCKLYHNFGMATTLRLGDKPDYQYSSLFGVITKSLMQVLSSGVVKFFTKAGPSNQVGGEVLFEDGKITWCHRMTSTRDHTSIPNLKTLLGFAA